MAKKNLKQKLIITAIGISALLGVAGFGMRAKYKDNPKLKDFPSVQKMIFIIQTVKAVFISVSLTIRFFNISNI